MAVLQLLQYKAPDMDQSVLDAKWALEDIVKQVVHAAAAAVAVAVAVAVVVAVCFRRH
jgi:hypothetical protein